MNYLPAWVKIPRSQEGTNLHTGTYKQYIYTGKCKHYIQVNVDKQCMQGNINTTHDVI